MSAQAIIALTLTGLATFKRRDLNLHTGVPVVVKRGDTIGVSEDVAEQLLNPDNITRDADHNEIPFFTVAAEGTKLAYDFVTKPDVVVPEPKGERSTTHDLSILPKTEQLSAEHVADKIRPPVRGQRRGK